MVEGDDAPNWTDKSKKGKARRDEYIRSLFTP
jgi:hypothetical protein